MKINRAYYIKGGTDSSHFPEHDLPEICLSGRSNVGKSTFINAITHQNHLAKTSSRPGKTQTLNWFFINESFYFVDVPGYGYAKVGQKQREAFGKMIENYITTRPNLKGMILLVDHRHRPTEDDILMYRYLKYFDKKVLVVATKEDKLKRNDRKKMESIIKERLQFEGEDRFIAYSSETKLGLSKIEEALDWLLED